MNALRSTILLIVATLGFGLAAIAQNNENTGGNDNALGAGNNNAVSGNNAFGGNNNTGGGNNAFGGNNNTGGGNNALGAGNNATGNNATGNNSAFGGGNNPAAAENPAAGVTNAAAVPNAAPVNPVPINPVVAPVNAAAGAPINTAAGLDGAAAGEPPVEGQPDLAGEEATGSESEVAPTPSAGGRPVKLDFRGAPLNEVIRALGDESGVNFVFPPDIGQKPIYVNLTGVPFNDALKAVLESNALGMMEVGPNIVRIDTLERLATDKENEEKRKRAELKLRPTKVLVYRLSYAKADEAQKMLSDMLGAAAREDGRITVQTDQRTNSVIVKAPPVDLTMVKALLERIDLETPQVKIASRIVEVQKKFSELFGISWTPQLNFDQGRGLGFGNLTFPNSMNSRFAVDASGNNQQVGNLGFRFGSINNSFALDLALSMEENRSTIEILQSSNLIVEDNADAEIVAGSSDFFRLVGARAAGAAGEDLAEVTYNLTMKVKPHITADGAVQMKITLESDSPSPPASQGGGAIAAKNNRGITTSLLRRSGETAVIGGVYNTTKSQANAGVPWLMNIPIIGALFRNSDDKEEKRELLVMVTPTILNGAKPVVGSDGDGSEGEIATNVENINDNNNTGGGQGNFGLGNSNEEGGGDDVGFGDDGANNAEATATGAENQQAADNQAAGNNDEQEAPADEEQSEGGDQEEPAEQEEAADEEE